MLIEINKELTNFKPLTHYSISDAIGENEKKLENLLSELIGDILFPEYLVFGNERNFQKEPDIFAINNKGDLVLFEIKVNGEYDRNKILQAMDYAQRFSYWRYNNMSEHYKKCFPNQELNLLETFEYKFGYKIDESDFNRNQKIIVISNSSSYDVKDVTDYWRKNGINIEEYFYRFYNIQDKIFFELSNELYSPNENQNHCWINTCSKYFDEAYIDMIKNKKASAYGDRRGIIGKWLNKSYIFIYHNGYGIIAAGKGTAKVDIDIENEITEELENCIYLENFMTGVNISSNKIEQYITPSEIRVLLERDFYFSNTKVSLSIEESEKIFDSCKKRFVIL